MLPSCGCPLLLVLCASDQKVFVSHFQNTHKQKLYRYDDICVCQNCAAEFVTKIVERIEELTQGTSHQTLLKWHFGGSFAHQTIRFGDTIPPEHRSSSREEPFVTLGLDIAGKKSIVESLASWAEGERMEGQNQLNCDFLPEIGGKTQKVDGLRRTCISKLPNTLIIHLKRFGIDYTTFTPYKINTFCEFPDILDMHKYTAEYLEKTEAELAIKAGNKKSADEDEDEAREEESKSAAVHAVDCTYKLSGVVVHQGAAGGRHYWSLARSDAGEWVKFNDITVTSFAKADFAEETNGGSFERTTRNQLGESTTVQVERFKNAYILYYERVVPVIPDIPKESPDLGTLASAGAKESTEGSATVIADSASTPPGAAADNVDTSKMLERIMRGLRVASDATVGDNKKLHGLREWAPEVWKENSKVQRKRYLYNTKFFDFVSKLAITSAKTGVIDIPADVAGMGGASAEKLSLRTDLAMYAYSILHEVIMCSKKTGNMDMWIKAMQGLLQGQADLCARIVAKSADDSHTMRRLLIDSGRDVRKVYGSILSFAVTQMSEGACQECEEEANHSSDGTGKGFVDLGNADDVGASKTAKLSPAVTAVNMNAEDNFAKFGTGVLPALLSALVKTQVSVMRAWIKSESFLQLYADMVAGPPHVQKAIIRQNAISAMCHLYLGRNSAVANMPELPKWELLDQNATLGAFDLSPIVRIINLLIDSCGNGLSDLPISSLHALRQTYLIKKTIRNSPALMSTLLPALSRADKSMTVCSIEAVLNASSRAATNADDLVTLLVAVLSIEDRYAEFRLNCIFKGMDVGSKSIQGLVNRAKSKTRAIQNPRAAKSAYKLIKIISLLDMQFPPAKEWLVKNKEDWVSLVDWLHTESYETSLNGDRFKLLRRASAEETVLSLAVTGDVTLPRQNQAVLGGPALDRGGNAQFGWWQGIRTASNLNYARHGFTDTARAVLNSPCPEDGRIREVRLLMGSNRTGIHDGKQNVQDEEYFVEVFNPVSNDMEANVASGLDMTPRLFPESPAGAMFNIGDKVECAAPRQGALDPMCGFVTNITLNAEGFVYDLAYEDASHESGVQEFLCAKADKDTVNEQKKRYAFQLVSTAPLSGVCLLEARCQRFVVDIEVGAGQYIGIRSKSGKLNLFYHVDTYGTGDRNRGVDGLIFTRTQTGTEAIIGHIDYNMKPDPKATWGFTATVRYDSVVSKDGPGDFDTAAKTSLTNHVSSLDTRTSAYFPSKGDDSEDDDDDDDDDDDLWNNSYSHNVAATYDDDSLEFGLD